MAFSDAAMMELDITQSTDIHNTRSLIRALRYVLDILQTEEAFTVEEYKHTHTHTTVRKNYNYLKGSSRLEIGKSEYFKSLVLDATNCLILSNFTTNCPATMPQWSRFCSFQGLKGFVIQKIQSEWSRMLLTTER